jgi:hypothetical protein
MAAWSVMAIFHRFINRDGPERSSAAIVSFGLFLTPGTGITNS